MRFEQGRTRDEFLAELRATAGQAWGPERLEPLREALENAAGALWRLAESPLEPLEAEPDFISGGAARGEAE
jgi:hypothetical protein